MARVPKAELDSHPAATGAAKARETRSSGLDDRELVRRAQQADKEAFEELIRRHQHRVFAVAGGILRRSDLLSQSWRGGAKTSRTFPSRCLLRHISR